jgi:hypothetical protein
MQSSNEGSFRSSWNVFEPLLHLVRRFVCERQRQYAKVVVAGTEQSGDALGQHPSLSGAGASDH